MSESWTGKGMTRGAARSLVVGERHAIWTSPAISVHSEDALRFGSALDREEWLLLVTSSTLSLTSALNMGGWLTPRPGRFTPPGKTRYPLYRRLCGPQVRFGQVRINLSPPGFDPRTAQPVANRYTD
jgi:hypothetical protein